MFLQHTEKLSVASIQAPTMTMGNRETSCEVCVCVGALVFFYTVLLCFLAPTYSYYLESGSSEVIFYFANFAERSVGGLWRFGTYSCMRNGLI